MASIVPSERLRRELHHLIAGAGDEKDDAAELEVTNGASANERLRHVFHFNRGLHSCLHADLGAGTLQGQAIDHGREHSHVISGGAVHSAMCRGSSAPDVTSTDHDTDLHVEIAHFLNSLRDGEDDLRRNIFPRTGDLKRFAA